MAAKDKVKDALVVAVTIAAIAGMFFLLVKARLDQAKPEDWGIPPGR